MSSLTIAVVGAGHWGPNIVRNFSNHPRARLRYVCDIDEEKLEKVSNLVSKECRLVARASEIFNDPDIDAVAIASPASTHYSLVKQALGAGKHVYCEKPLTLDATESEELCGLAESRNLKLMVGFTFLFNNGVRQLKKLKETGALGAIYYLTSIRTHMGLVREDVDVVWDLAPHDVSIINFILGASPDRVLASGVKPLGGDNHDAAFINLYYPGGIMGQISVSWVDSNKERLVRIIGGKARAEFNDLNNLEPIRIFEKGISVASESEADFGKFRFLLRDGDIISPKTDMSEPLGEMVDSFVGAVLDDKDIISNGRYSLDITRTLAAIQRSLSSGRIEDVLIGECNEHANR